MRDPRNLLIVGASARAAAQSAVRAEFTVTAIDLFADEDLAACANVIRCDDYPNGLARLAERAPPGPWLYTGGLENHPQIVAAISANRPLWGNGGAVLRRIRDPIAVHATLAQASLPTLEVTLNAANLPRDSSWLAKPLASGGGKQIHPLDEASPSLESRRHHSDHATATWYFQRRQRGLAASAVFVGVAGRGVLLAVTEQLVGEPWSVGSPFQYAGSIFPLVHDNLLDDERFMEEIGAIGDRLAGEFGLVGLFGVDGVICDRRFWPVEVNPRYPASCEVVEQGSEFNAVAIHAAACDEQEPLSPEFAARRPGCCGKLIVYAEEVCRFGEDAARWVALLTAEDADCRAADIPAIGTEFSRGEPVLTVLANSSRPADLKSRLKTLAAELRGRLESLGC